MLKHLMMTACTLLLSGQLLAADKPHVLLTTSLGEIELELDDAKAPVTVANFLAYVDKGFYSGTIFHRVIPGFMIQGGGLTPQGKTKQTTHPIPNESSNGLKNLRGTVAMARTNNPDSATAQFFINHKDNDFLDHKPGSSGYAVFGKVVRGMEVVELIAKTPTSDRGSMQNVPITTVLIESAQRLQ
ncbi:peptidyl-prolyl cis-trans isomerase A (cyclophilin A) [Pseudomonas fluvialis]|uniref:Peptidyl-prolyl cis-trans isomerase n=1 Tax=Pseudomonas fluvialis TaxID=1793966 RepID=A0A7X0BRA9_9PSED|nr:peptidylprolyl isomerase [Pseudomonas fluvialis]MBB6341335.1 peptidyl-prolyl cis-trans isomerase A (cyclophilin A) [Pseudomonas fluvialis]